MNQVNSINKGIEIHDSLKLNVLQKIIKYFLHAIATDSK